MDQGSPGKIPGDVMDADAGDAQVDGHPGQHGLVVGAKATCPGQEIACACQQEDHQHRGNGMKEALHNRLVWAKARDRRRGVC